MRIIRSLRPHTAVWSAPIAWTVFAALMVALARTDLLHASVVSAAVLLGVGLARTVTHTRGGGAGRLSELVLFGGGIAWMLASPGSHRCVVSLAVALSASGLALAGAWRRADALGRERLALVAGTIIGLTVAAGTAGAPLWGLKMGFVIVSVALTAHLLVRVAGPLLALAATVALAASIGSAHVAGWLLPPLVALALVALGAGLPWTAAAAGVLAALAPPAGLAVAAGLIAASARKARSAWPLSLLGAAVLLGWWRLPAGETMWHLPSLGTLGVMLPLTPLAAPFLLPAAAVGLTSRSHPAAEGRDALGIGMALVPFVTGGAWSAAAVAALWLTALPAARARSRAVRATLPWTFGAGGALLLASPWGGAVLPGFSPVLIAGGWLAAVVASLTGWEATAFVWVVPVAGLIWTTPVEGIDRHIAPGQAVHLSTRSSGWVVLAGTPVRSLVPGTPVLVAGEGRHPLRAGCDVPAEKLRPRHPIVLPSGRGRDTRLDWRGVTHRRWSGGTRIVASVPLVIRTEAYAAWRARRHRFAWLAGGALLLLLLAAMAPRASPLPASIGLTALLGGLVAAGSGYAPLARAAFRAGPDLAAVAWLAAAAVWVPKLGGKRVLAGFLLLVPLAVAQPVLRHPAGDEVYNLKLEQSLVRDHDLDITNNIDRSNPAEAIYLANGPHLIHSPGLALAALPAYVLFGWTGSLLTVAWLVALAAGLAARRACELGFGRRAVTLAWLLSLATYPALTFATQLWPAAAGMAAAAILLWAVSRSARWTAIIVAAASILVKVRLGLVTLPMAAAAAFKKKRRWWGMVALAAAVAAVSAAVAMLLGGPLGVHHLRELEPPSVIAALRAVWGLAWDAAGGLLAAAPLWLVALIGVPEIWRRGGIGERTLIVGGGLTVLALAPRGEWWGGGSPPARYLAPLLPLIVLALAAVARRRRGRRVMVLVLPWAALAAWIAVTHPLWWFNPTDGGFWLADAMARTLHAAARRVFPSLIRPDMAALTVPIGCVLVALWWSRMRRTASAALALLTFSMAVAWAVTVPETRIDVEDPQVIHMGGHAQPPPGTFFRSAHGISWRLQGGQSVIIPWHPPFDAPLELRARLARGRPGTLAIRWNHGVPAVTGISARRWRFMALPGPSRPGRGRLRLTWEGPPGSMVDLDRVEVRP